MNDIQVPTIDEPFTCKGELQPGALVFEAHLKYAGDYQSMEITCFQDGKAVWDRGLYSFFIEKRGTGSYVKFQFSDRCVESTDKYTLNGTIHFRR